MSRYERQILSFGEDGQEAIRSATVGLVGCGGLGTNVSTALASAGIGKLIIMDPDYPEMSNLNRQYVYSRDLGSGRYKAEILAEWIQRINPEVEVEYRVDRFDADTSSFFDECDIMVDCLDSVGSRLDLNEYCVRTGKPLVHGGVVSFLTEMVVCIPGKTPCLKCIFKDIPEPKKPLPSIGAVVTSIGSMEASEVLKLILGKCDTAGTFIYSDLENLRFNSIKFERDPNCPVCGRINAEK